MAYCYDQDENGHIAIPSVPLLNAVLLGLNWFKVLLARLRRYAEKECM